MILNDFFCDIDLEVLKYISIFFYSLQSVALQRRYDFLDREKEHRICDLLIRFR